MPVAAVRVGPVRTGSDAGRRLPAFRQAYRPRSNVLETVLPDGSGGRLSITDVLPWPDPGPAAAGQVLRVLRAPAGPVEVEVEVIPAGAWGPAREVRPFEGGLVMDGLAVRTGFPLHFEPLGREAPRWRGVARLEAGAVAVVTLEGSALLRPQSPESAQRAAAATEAAWRSWLAPLVYDGLYRAAVERSLLAARSLCGPGGAPAGAGTTSLPRRPGSERGRDDRWVSLRDAATAAATWANAGFPDDAEAAEGWLARIARDIPLPWPPALDADGQPVPELQELGLTGWRRSGPVVTGRPAGVVDLDLFGDVVAAYGTSTSGPGGAGGLAPLSAAWPALAAAVDWVGDHWGAPDAGVWESAGPPGLLVASRVQAWSAVDRMARLGRAANPLDLQAAAWHQEARRILTWLETEGVAPDGGLRRDGAPGRGDAPDAALLRIAWRGPWPLAHPIVTATVDRVLQQLGSAGFVYRYGPEVDDGRAGPDNPDLLASLWAVRALARLGRWEEGHAAMEAVTGAGGDLGLLAEAIDPVSGELMGNLPAAAVHLALVDAALALAAGPR
jgi:GH15 family glucan-1,4-alpha-glucosidase